VKEDIFAEHNWDMTAKKCADCFKNWDDFVNDGEKEMRRKFNPTCDEAGHNMQKEILPPDIKRPRLNRCTRCGRTEKDIQEHDTEVSKVIGDEEVIYHSFPLCHECDIEYHSGYGGYYNANECCLSAIFIPYYGGLMNY
jgi:hypothetical protein